MSILIDYRHRAYRPSLALRLWGAVRSLTAAGWFWSGYFVLASLVLLVVYSWCVVPGCGQ